MKMKKNKLILIDGNHMLHRAFHKYNSMMTPQGECTSMIYGFPYMLRKIVNENKKAEIIVIFDGKNRSKHRLAVLPGYKRREQKLGFDRENFILQKKEVIRTLACLGIKVAMSNEEEGDDILYLVAKKYKAKGYHITIISGDKDFNQLICEDIYQFQPGAFKKPGILLTPENLEEEKGYKAHQCVTYLSLLGDSSDKIPGYPSIGDKRAKQFIEKYDTLKKAIKGGEDNFKFGSVNFKELKTLYKVNKLLIDLKYYNRKYLRRMPIPWINKNSTKFNKKELMKIAKEYHIGTFVKTDFLKHFKNN